jgi:prepilin-type N-terminal cleavage/methylation domain-containing protein
MNVSKFPKNAKGFSLIETLVAAAILGILLLVTMNMISASQKGTDSISKRLSSGELRSFITQILNNSQVCGLSLIGKPAPAVGASVPTLSFAGINIDDTANNLFEGGKIKILSLKYSSVAISGSLYTSVITLKVSLQGSSTESVIGGNTIKPIDFPLTTQVSGGLISGCSSGIDCRVCIEVLNRDGSTTQAPSKQCTPYMSAGGGASAFSDPFFAGALYEQKARVFFECL